jgi:REP element-mobilizing transposase RayT
MQFERDYIYHVYNRSNETVFKSEENYLFFLKKVRRLIYPVCNILAWCLMPNHFHFLIHANEKSILSANEKHRPSLQQLSKNIGSLLSSYTKAINKSHQRRGKLFAHNTKAKQITQAGNNYIVNCFFYIHQNPLEAHIVKKLEDWEYSSFRDFAGFRKGTLCNKDLAFEIINYSKENFIEQSYAVIDEKIIKKFY